MHTCISANIIHICIQVSIPTYICMYIYLYIHICIHSYKIAHTQASSKLLTVKGSHNASCWPVP